MSNTGTITAFDALLGEVVTAAIRGGYLEITKTEGGEIALGLTEDGRRFLDDYLRDRRWKVTMEGAA